ncbi:MAG: hypothetical protein MZV64_10670 [Ignavibacteriales bacterium]|nr:hypothetical protein [Ignavibacteriales bacterium]
MAWIIVGDRAQIEPKIRESSVKDVFIIDADGIVKRATGHDAIVTDSPIPVRGRGDPPPPYFEAKTGARRDQVFAYPVFPPGAAKTRSLPGPSRERPPSDLEGRAIGKEMGNGYHVPHY